MPNPHLSILVVDDAKFSSTMIGRALSNAGYLDVRFASSAREALGLLEQRPANVLLADWLMPEMDGLELTSCVRQLDEAHSHYTYIILLTGKEGDNVLHEAFDRGVDDFINKAAMNEQLVPRVYAADRLCCTLHQLIQQNRLLLQNIAGLEQRNLIDPVTGLGNLRHLNQMLADSLRQIDARGGALCFLLIGLQDAHLLRRQHGEAYLCELRNSVAHRLQQLLRPLDVLCSLDEQHFAVLAMLGDLQECSPNSFKRLHEGLNLKAFKTSEGFVTLKAGIALVGMDASNLPVSPERILEHARGFLADSYSSGRVAAERLLAGA